MSYNGNDFMKASKLANELKFEEVNITENHMETCLILFMDDRNGTWSIDGTYNGRYRMMWENESVCVIGKELENQIDVFIQEWKEDQEMADKLSSEYIETRDYLFREFGYGKN